MMICWLSRCSLWLAVALFPLPLAHKAHAEVHNAEGVWAAEYELPVKWRMNMALDSGRGAVRLYALVARKTEPGADPTHFVESIKLCAVEQPPTKTLGLYGGERFSVAYETDALGPEAAAYAHWQGGALEDRLVSEPAAVQIGVDLPSPMQSPWPRDAQKLAPHLMALSHEELKGAKANSRADHPYVWPPVDISASRRAHTFYIASRTAFSSSLVFVDGDTMEGTASLENIAGRMGLNTTIVGCETDDGGRCSPADLTLTNSFQPTMRADGTGRARLLRVAPDIDCAELRSLFP